MFQTFYPDQRIDSVYDYDFESARKQGYLAVLFDVDNTLVPHGAPADEKAIRLFERLHKLGFRT